MPPRKKIPVNINIPYLTDVGSGLLFDCMSDGQILLSFLCENPSLEIKSEFMTGRFDIAFMPMETMSIFVIQAGKLEPAIVPFIPILDKQYEEWKQVQPTQIVMDSILIDSKNGIIIAQRELRWNKRVSSEFIQWANQLETTSIPDAIEIADMLLRKNTVKDILKNAKVRIRIE